MSSSYWLAVYSAKHDRHYFYNSVTKETTWQRPENIDDLTQVSTDSGYSSPEIWSVHYDDKHKRPYYYNKKTGKSTWTRPRTLSQQQALEADRCVQVGRAAKKRANRLKPISDALHNSSLSENTTTTQIGSGRSAFSPSPTRISQPSPHIASVDEPIVPSWRSYFNTKGVQSKEAEKPKVDKPAEVRKPVVKGAAVPVLETNSKEETVVQPKKQLPFLQEMKKTSNAPRAGVPAFLGEMKAKAFGQGLAAPTARRQTAQVVRSPTLLDEIKSKIKNRRETANGGLIAESMGLKQKPTALRTTQEQAADRPSSWPRGSIRDLPKPHQNTILEVLLSKSKELTPNPTPQPCETGSQDDDWSSEEDVELDTTPVKAPAWKPSFRFSKSGAFQLQCEGDDWKDFTDELNLDVIESEEKALSEDSHSSEVRRVQIKDMTNTLKHYESLKKCIKGMTIEPS